MKLVQQDTVFSPIAIILETRDEAEMFWDIMEHVDCDNPSAQNLVNDICNLFSTEAKL